MYDRRETDLLTLPEAALLVPTRRRTSKNPTVAVSTVRRWVRSGVLQGYGDEFSNTILVSKTQLLAITRARRVRYRGRRQGWERVAEKEGSVLVPVGVMQPA